MAVGTLTLGLAQLGAIPDRDHIGTMIVVLAFGGLVQFLAGIASIRFHEPFCGVALTTYGFFWITVCSAKLVSADTTFQLSPVPYAQLNFVYFVFAAVMVYLTAYRSATLSLLCSMVAATCFLTFLARLDLLTDTRPGIGHIVVGLTALYHAVGSITFPLPAANWLRWDRRCCVVAREVHLRLCHSRQRIMRHHCVPPGVLRTRDCLENRAAAWLP